MPIGFHLDDVESTAVNAQSNTYELHQQIRNLKKQLETIRADTIKDALDIAWSYGQIDGSHHRLWVIDQMVRALLGEEDYKKWVEKYETPDGEDYWEWDVGIAP